MSVTPPLNFTFSDDFVFFLKKKLGGGHKFSEFACFIYFYINESFKFKQCKSLSNTTFSGFRFGATLLA